jgi:epoxyqueuosine reductase
VLPGFFASKLLLMAVTSASIKQKALELGFAKVGIVPATPLVDERERLKEWLARGYHGQMAWLARDPEKRTDPTQLFPGAKSVVSLALNYFTGHKHQDDGRGKISRYAWGDDYHDVMRHKMQALLDWVRSEDESVSGKICVDTAPLMDKALAVRAGLGWIGRHSNLITREVGSWVFLGEIVLDTVLDYDSVQVDDHCGTCRACIDACPTSAIVEPYVVDSNRCISYATIEYRGEELPNHISDSLNGWFYGCDICQEVCPWNRFEVESGEPRFEPRNAETSVNLDDVDTWTPEQYAERFRRSAIKRAKLPALKRNAAAIKKAVSSER